MDAVRETRRVARREWINDLNPTGPAAQGVCFRIVGALAVQLALGAESTTTDPRSVLDALTQQGWTRLLLVPVSLAVVLATDRGAEP